MIQQIYAPEAPASGFALSAAVSPAVTELVDRVRPSVVQVRSGRRGNGTGVIWRADGVIMTNDHVVAHAHGQLQVTLTDGRTLDATLTARNPRLDLALLRVDARDLPAAIAADSRLLRVGELVLAIGHPWGQPWVVTAGIVSAVGEVPVNDEGGKAAYIRSDVRLAPGNSGGPMLNARGEVIGINAMIFGGDLAVAIPSHVATGWLALQPGRKPAFGVKVQRTELPEAARQDAWANRAAGLLIVGIEPGGAAERAGLLVGDLLLDGAGVALENPNALRELLERDTGSPLRLYLLRAGAVTAIDLRLG